MAIVTSAAVATLGQFRKRSTSIPNPSCLGHSLEALTEAAAHPPAILNRLSMLNEEPVVLYIFRVPGRRDLCLSFFRPGRDVVTHVDVMSAVYYCRFDDDDTCTILRRDPKTGNYSDVAQLMDPPGHIDVFEKAYSEIEKRYWSLIEQDRFSPNSNYGCYLQEREGVLNFITPWTGSCELTPSKLGTALKCHHFLRSFEGDPTIKRQQVSELRFNFQTTSSIKPTYGFKQTQAAAVPLIKQSSSAVATQVRHLAEEAQARKRSFLNHIHDDSVTSPHHALRASSDAMETDTRKFVISAPAPLSSSNLETNSMIRQQFPHSPVAEDLQKLSLDPATSGYVSAKSSATYTIPDSPSKFIAEPSLPDDTHDFALHSHPPTRHSVLGPRPMTSRSTHSSVILSSPESDDADTIPRASGAASVGPGATLPSVELSPPVKSSGSVAVQSTDLSNSSSNKDLQMAVSSASSQIRRKPVGSGNRPQEAPIPPIPFDKSTLDRPSSHASQPNGNKENASPVPSARSTPPSTTRRARPSTTTRPVSMFIPDQQADRVLVDEHRKSLRELRELAQHQLPDASEERYSNRKSGYNRNSSRTVPSSYRAPFTKSDDSGPADDGDSTRRHNDARSHSESPSLHPIPDLYPDNGSPSPPPARTHPEPHVSLPNPPLPPLSKPPPVPQHQQQQQQHQQMGCTGGGSGLDLTLGREKLGGGFDGEQAKLGKLIVEPEGQRMLDLLVSVNVMAFTRAARYASVL